MEKFLFNAACVKGQTGNGSLSTLPRTPRIGWILSMDRDNASSRLQGYLIHEWMLRQGIDSAIVATHFQRISSPFDRRFIKIARQLRAGNFTHVVLESPEWTGVQLSTIFKLWGGISICVRCDNIKGQYDNYFDTTILPTTSLADSLGVKRRNIIPDCVEVPAGTFKTSYSAGQKIRVVWVGHSSYGEYLTRLVTSLKTRPLVEMNFAFTLISKGDFADRQWSEQTVFRDILECDIALIPVPEGGWFTTKSSNRLAMMMALGMPILASRIPSYLEIGKDGRNVLFVDDEEHMVEALRSLQDPEFRSALGSAARSDLGGRFSIERIGPLWARAILGAVDVREQMQSPSVRVKLLASLLCI